MATKSVLKSIHIKNKNAATRLVSALEHAPMKRAKEVVNTRTFSDAGREEIRKMFGLERWQDIGSLIFECRLKNWERMPRRISSPSFLCPLNPDVEEFARRKVIE